MTDAADSLLRRHARRDAAVKAEVLARFTAADRGSPEWLAAREDLLAGCYALVVSIANRWACSGVDLQDLIQEGCLGVMEAADRFDPAKGAAFTTYAHLWISCKVREHARVGNAFVKPPVAKRDGRRMIPEPRFRIWIPLDTRPSRSGESPAGAVNFLPGADGREPERAVFGAELVETIRRVTTDREFDIVMRRAGLDRPRESLPSIAKSYGLTYQRIRQILRAVGAKLRGHLKDAELFQDAA